MKRVYKSLALLGLLSLPLQEVAAKSFCFNDDEFKDFVLLMAPAALNKVGAQCAALLPNGEVLGNPQSVLARNVRAAADEAWPRVGPASLRALAREGKTLPDGLKLTRDKLDELLGQAFVDEIKVKPESCASADKLLKLAEPLPPANLAAMIVEVMHMSSDGSEMLCPRK